MYNEHYCVRNAFCFSCWPKINIPSARSQCQAQFSPSPRTYIEQKCILLFWLFFSFCQIRQIHASQASACFIEFNFNSHTHNIHVLSYLNSHLPFRLLLSMYECMTVCVRQLLPLDFVAFSKSPILSASANLRHQRKFITRY